MEELNHVTPITPIEPAQSHPQLDPEIEEAAKHSDMPDGLVYDTTDIEQGGAGNMPMLTLVLVFIGMMLFVFGYFVYHLL